MTFSPPVIRFTPLLLVPLMTTAGGLAVPGQRAEDQSAVWWRPAAGLDWQMQLTGTLSLEPGRDVFFLDQFEAPDSAIVARSARGTRVVCCFSAGSLEDWRRTFRPFRTGSSASP